MNELITINLEANKHDIHELGKMFEETIELVREGFKLSSSTVSNRHGYAYMSLVKEVTNND